MANDRQEKSELPKTEGLTTGRRRQTVIHTRQKLASPELSSSRLSTETSGWFVATLCCFDFYKTANKLPVEK